MALPFNYHWRNLLVRRTTTTLTVLVVAAVVATFAWLLAVMSALNASLAVASDPQKLLVLRRGTTSETNSYITPEEFNRLAQLDAVQRDAAGAALISPELYWQTQLPRAGDPNGLLVNVALRGVTDLALKVHANVRLLGPSFSTGSPEVIAGRRAAQQFAGLRVGDSVRLGQGENREYKVVGHFSADGGPLESEIWMYLPSMQSAYNRPGYSSAAVRLRADANVPEAIERIAGPAIQLNAVRESEYWASQAGIVRAYQFVCSALVAVMTLAAVFAVANTLYGTVAGRTREIAMLRTIGYRRHHILTGFVSEAVLLALAGGLIGCGACYAWLRLAGNTKDMFTATSFTALAFEIHMTPMVVVVALASVAVVGAAGAFFPALRAARLDVLAALRSE